ncbi:MAG: pimelyl-ACP methyl ester esterase BioV [Campylobacterales bacterium]
MIFFSGFGFQNEAPLFEDFLPQGEGRFTVAGFSRGAIEAFEYAASSPTRIERLILLSPAFFQTQSDKFRRLQLMGFNKSPQSYFAQFYAACGSKRDLSPFQTSGNAADLEALLNYRWEAAALQALIDRGTRVTVYLGGKDAIIDANGAAAFFSAVTEVYFLKNATHLLEVL